MFSPEDLFRAIDQTFARSALVDLRAYLAQRSGATKWIISSDYCLHDKTKLHDVYAYTIFPYDDEFANLQAEVRSASPNDLKKIKSVCTDMLSYLGDQRRFHTCFLVTDSSKVFAVVDEERRKTIRESIGITLTQLKGIQNAETHLAAIKRFNELNQYVQKKSFDESLIEDMYLASTFAAYLAVQLIREAKPSIIGWFSDRDKITSTAFGAVYDWWHFNLNGLVELHGNGNPMPEVVTSVPNPATNAAGNLWYDDLVRVPDFFAGTIASWDYENNKVPGEQPKYAQMAKDVIADHPSLVVLHLNFRDDGQLACARKVANKTTNASPDETQEPPTTA